MSKCKCGRELRPGEKQCPACSAKKSHGWKRIVEVGSSIVAGVWTIVVIVRKFIKFA